MIKVRCIGFEYSISALLPKLEKIKRQKAEIILGQYDPNSYPVISYSQSTTNTKDSYTTSNMNDFKKIIMSLKRTIAKKQQTLKKFFRSEKQKANELAINCFLNSVFDNTALPEKEYNYDFIKDLRLQFKELKIN
ncbi:15836_t:CDS:2 [Cetraspora pellucida]|uniref:15836_t:CDS:1 n=1 Tax=Cetraspora pellucida TaxID=1433469 RepID=A0ACA9KQ70_9GLOM|nr:15836_t:CDS:2 [Cetraspora pellucida]